MDRWRPVPGIVARPQVEPPGAVGQRVARRTPRGLLDGLRGPGIGRGLLRPRVREAVDAAWGVGLTGPDELDRRIVRPRVDGVAQARDGWVRGRRPVDPERADVERLRPVAGAVARPEVEPPGAVGERIARGARYRRVYRLVGRRGRGARPGDRVPGDAARPVRRWNHHEPSPSGGLVADEPDPSFVWSGVVPLLWDHCHEYPSTPLAPSE